MGQPTTIFNCYAIKFQLEQHGLCFESTQNIRWMLFHNVLLYVFYYFYIHIYMKYMIWGILDASWSPKQNFIPCYNIMDLIKCNGHNIWECVYLCRNFGCMWMVEQHFWRPNETPKNNELVTTHLSPFPIKNWTLSIPRWVLKINPKRSPKTRSWNLVCAILNFMDAHNKHHDGWDDLQNVFCFELNTHDQFCNNIDGAFGMSCCCSVKFTYVWTCNSRTIFHDCWFRFHIRSHLVHVRSHANQMMFLCVQPLFSFIPKQHETAKQNCEQLPTRVLFHNSSFLF